MIDMVTPATLPREALDTVLYATGYDFPYWTHVHIDLDAPDGAPVLTVDGWQDGELRPAPDNRHPDYQTHTATRDQLRSALVSLSLGRLTDSPYQRRAARELLCAPDVADADYYTADMVIQYALYRQITFG